MTALKRGTRKESTSESMLPDAHALRLRHLSAMIHEELHFGVHGEGIKAGRNHVLVAEIELGAIGGFDETEASLPIEPNDPSVLREIVGLDLAALQARCFF